MKKVFLAVLMTLIFAGVAMAQPFLISDPYGTCGELGTTACPVSAEIFQDGLSIATDVTLESDLSIRYDLGTMPMEEHVYTATYQDDLERVSVPSNPYLFLAAPTSPTNVSIIP